MKTIWKYLATMTVAVIALVSCNREKENDSLVPVNSETTLHITVTATADDINGDAETKTYIDMTLEHPTILWGKGEYMKIGVFDGTTTAFGDSSDESANQSNGNEVGTFSFDITPTNASDDYTYYGLYPKSAAVSSNNTNPASFKVNLPASQKATPASYDPSAYILVAQPESGKTESNANWNAYFRRATALNKITLKGLNEDIKRVKITAPTGTYLAGSRYIDLTTGESGEIYNGGGRTETIEVRFASKLNGGADMDIWFASWDASISVGSHLVIVAYSDAHTFTRNITVEKEIAFKEGCLNMLKVNMANAEQANNTELEEGDYVVLAKDGDNYYALKAEKESGKERLLSVAYEGSLDSYYGDGDIVWRRTKSGNSFIFENDGKYLGYKNSSNESYWLAASTSWTETNYLLNVTAQETAGLYHVTLNSNANRYLSKNNSGAFFAFYGNTGQKADIVFVPATVDDREVVTLSFEDDEQNETSAVNLTTEDYDTFFGLTLVASPNEAAITNNIVWSYEDNDGVIDEFDNGALTLTGDEGTATVTATFAGDGDFKAASASYTINVSSASTATDVFKRITSTNDLTLGDTAEYLLIYVPSEGTPLAFNGSLKSGYDASAGVSVTFDSNGDADYNLYKANALTISSASAANKYLIKTAGGVFIGRTGDSNGLSEFSPSPTNPTPSNNDFDNGISFNSTTGVVSITGEGGRALMYYPANSNYRYYSAGNLANMFLYKHVDTRQAAGMSWSATSATATYNTGNTLSFTAPTLTFGNASASSVSYSSSDPTIATINNAGVVSVNLSENVVKVGSTTISAAFAGNTEYRPQTVSYTLSVVDSRDNVAKPVITFDNGNATITCATTGATIHYTIDGTDPTSSSSVYSQPFPVTDGTTVKAIATMTGYKDSEGVDQTYSAGGNKPTTSTLLFTAACSGSGTADDGAKWAITSDGAESQFSSDYGIHYGTNNAAVTYVQLSTSDISGTITRVVVNARDAQAVATISVSVGGTAFTCSGSTTATNSSADYTFTGSGSGAIVVRVERSSSMTKAIYVKSVVVTYNDNN